MKQIYLLVISCLYSTILFSQEQLNVFQNDYKAFEANQLSKFVKADRELFTIDGINWVRPYGEYEYALTPMVQDISDYVKYRKNSNFRFIRIQVSQLSRELLLKAHINVPLYVTDSVIAFLPEIDIDHLKVNNCGFRYLDYYGKQHNPYGEVKTQAAIIWSSGFEIPSFGTDFVGFWTGVDCNWDLATCKSHGGAKSAWCASSGTDCNPCGAFTVNSIESDFEKFIPINMSSYKNSLFKFWKWQDLDVSELDDKLELWINTGSGWALDATFKSDAPFNGAGWWTESTLLSGTIPSFNFRFYFQSNGSINAPGIYLDDIELSGAVNGTNDIDSAPNIQIAPNPSDGIFYLSSFDQTKEAEISISNIVGEVILNCKLQQEMKIDLTGYPAGLYFLKLKSEMGVTTSKLLLE